MLSTFVAVAEIGTVSGAAEHLHVTQPALSRQLQQLEHEIGVGLFVRERGRLALSAAGLDFLPRARDLLRRSDELRRAARDLAEGKLAEVRISAPTTTLTDVIVPFLATLGHDDPLPHVTIRDTAGSDDLQQVDLAITTSPGGPGTSSLPLAVLPLWAYVRDDHPWAGRTCVDVADLGTQTLLVLSERRRPRQILDAALQRSALPIPPLVECSDSQVAQALAAAGRGTAVVTDDPRFGLRALAIRSSDGPLDISLHAVWRHEHHAAAALRDVSMRLRRFCAERYGDGVLP